ncbi:TPA: FMN-binding negative transcriptional regulator [Staphylococcus aureus]|nr:FMN-binding negative transcriptional regulator [Staphylococcus aureus]
MHVPKYFQVDDFKEIEKFIHSNSFGMIVTVDRVKPIATHVPTWNYQAVHLYGESSILSEEETIDDLKRLLVKYERHREDPVLWDNISENTKMQAKGIVGFKVKIHKIEAAYKMSQNRNEKDYNNIIEKLEDESNASSVAVAQVMKNIHPYS